MDGASFASLAQIRILLLPVGNISKASFDKWASLVRSFQHLRLDEITPESREDRKRFMPTPQSPGYLHLAYPSHPPPSWHAPLSLFRPSHFPLGVVGIAECTTQSPIDTILASFQSTLTELFPKGSAFPMSSRCYVFDERDEPNMSATIGSPQLAIIPSVMGNKQLYIGTLLAELCSDILADFSNLARALESESGMEALNSRLLPQLAYADDTSDFAFRSRHSHDRMSLQATITTSSSLSNITRESMEINGRPTPRRAATTLTTSTSASLITPNGISTKKRTSMNVPTSCNGRAQKVVADLYLLAGLTADAVQCYMESLPLLKGPQDVIWSASALEGMCVAEILDAWAAGDGTQPPPPGAKQPWSDISERLNQVVSLYFRASPSGVTPSMPTPVAPSLPFDGELSSLSLLYSLAALRHSHFLLAVYTHGGWGKEAVEAMLHPVSSSSALSQVEAYRLYMSAFLTRTMVSNAVAQVHGPHLLHLHPHDRLHILNSMASAYSYLGLRRKEAYILREVLATVMDLLVTSRDEFLYTTTKSPPTVNGHTPGLAIQGVKSLPNSPAKRPTGGTVGVRPGMSTEGNAGVLKVVQYVCETYGLDLARVKLMKRGTAEETSNDEQDDLDSSLELFGWPELQIGVVREAVAVAEALPDYPTVAQYALSTIRTLHPYLSVSEQAHLYATSTRALETARRRGDDRIAAYWAERPVLSIEVTSLSILRLPVEHPITDLQPRQLPAEGLVTGRRDPFIYNPRIKASASAQTVVVQNEPIEFVLTLYNPYCFDLDIHQLCLSTEGPSIKADPTPTTVPSESYRLLRLTVTPLETGLLTVRGILAQLPNGTQKEFLLPVTTDEDEKQTERRRSMLDATSVRIKLYGLDARNKKRMSGTSTQGKKTFVICKVVEEQPLIRIRRSSLTHGALMLYDGETSTVRLTLENVSSIPVDFIKLTFDDSTVAAAQQALAEGDLSIADAYETEYDLTRRPVLTWQGACDEDIPPDQKTTVAVTCLGKYGCSSGSVHISYAYARRAKEASADVFHTRQIVYPIEITVYETLVARSMDIIPCWINEHQDDTETDDSVKKSILQATNPDEWCLFNVDVCNRYTVPFEVIFERCQDDVPIASSSRLVSPGATVRVILPIRRFSLDDAQVSKAIPTLSDRQFIVAKEKLSSADEQLQRELFWYREHLLSCVKARWKEPGTSRHGELSLRSQRLTLPMLRILRSPRCKVDLTVATDHEGVAVERRGRAFVVKHYRFVSLRARITNASNTALSLALSIIPASLSLLESALFDNSLAHIPVGGLAPGETKELDNGVCFVDCGRFEFKASLEAAGEGPLGGVETNICIIVED